MVIDFNFFVAERNSITDNCNFDFYKPSFCLTFTLKPPKNEKKGNCPQV
jgi:hypothetical protein